MFEVLYHHAKFVGDRISSADGAVKNVESVRHAFSVTLFLSRFFRHACDVTLLNVRVCAPDFTMKMLEYRNDSDAVG